MEAVEKNDGEAIGVSESAAERIEALLDLLGIDEHLNEGHDEGLYELQDPEGGKNLLNGHGEDHFGEGLLIDLTEVGAGPTVQEVRGPESKPLSNQKGRPDFRRIRQLLDDEAPSSSELDVEYETHEYELETPGNNSLGERFGS